MAAPQRAVLGRASPIEGCAGLVVIVVAAAAVHTLVLVLQPQQVKHQRQVQLFHLG